MTSQKDEFDGWDKFYRDGRFIMHWPSESVVRTISPRLSQLPEHANVLDLGCGAGRHLWFLARQRKFMNLNFRIFGGDVSERAVELANTLLTEEGLIDGVRISKFGAADLPYDEEFFSLVLSHAVLDQLIFSDAQNLVSEVKEKMKIGGIFIASFEMLKTSFGKMENHSGRLIDRQTFVNDRGPEKGLIQRYYTDEDIDALSAGFSSYRLLDVSAFSRGFHDDGPKESFQRKIIEFTR